MNKDRKEDIIQESNEVIVPHPESNTTTNYGTGPRMPKTDK